jgi:hypothetical protein
LLIEILEENKFHKVYDFSNKFNEAKGHFRLMANGEFELQYLNLPAELSTENPENEFIYDNYHKEFESLLDENASQMLINKNNLEEIIPNENMILYINNNINNDNSNNKNSQNNIGLNSVNIKLCEKKNFAETYINDSNIDKKENIELIGYDNAYINKDSKLAIIKAEQDNSEEKSIQGNYKNIEHEAEKTQPVEEQRKMKTFDVTTIKEQNPLDFNIQNQFDQEKPEEANKSLNEALSESTYNKNEYNYNLNNNESSMHLSDEKINSENNKNENSKKNENKNTNDSLIEKDNDDILIAGEEIDSVNNQEIFVSLTAKKIADFEVIEKEDSNKTISSFQDISYKGSSNENSIGSQPKITLNCANIEQVENYFTNSASNFTASNNNNNNNNNSNNLKTDLEKIKSEFVFVPEYNEEFMEIKGNYVIELLDLKRVDIDKRNKKIKEKIEYEYQRKVELKQKAFEYITNFQK